jgi:hypothetical protein
MIDQDRNFGTTTVYCDGKDCEAEENLDDWDGHCLPYSEVTKEIKESGWAVKYNNGNWEHFCPDCKDKI